jgi:flagellar biosynthesis chaperone FliJ
MQKAVTQFEDEIRQQKTILGELTQQLHDKFNNYPEDLNPTTLYSKLKQYYHLKKHKAITRQSLREHAHCKST